MLKPDSAVEYKILRLWAALLSSVFLEASCHTRILKLLSNNYVLSTKISGVHSVQVWFILCVRILGSITDNQNN